MLENKNKSSTWLWLLLVLIVIVGYFAYTGFATSDEHPTTTTETAKVEDEAIAD